MNNNDAFRNNLLLAQGRTGKTVTEIARKAGIRTQQYSVYMGGLYLPSAVNLYKIARALDVTMDELMEGVVEHRERARQ